MSLASQTARAPFARPSRWAIAWAIALLLTVALYAAVEYLPWAAKYPRDWVVPLRVWISGFMKWLINSADLGLFTFKELTRSIAWLLTWPLEAADGLLASGFKLVFGADEDVVYRLPRLSWIAVVAVVAMLGAHARDKWLAWRPRARQVARAAGRTVLPLSRRVRPVGQRDGDAVVDRRRRAARRIGRPAGRHLGHAQRAHRGDHHACARPHADRAGIRLSGAGAVPVRLRPGRGDDRDDHLRDAADGALYHAGAQAGRRRDRRVRPHGGLFAAPAVVEGDDPLGAPDPDGRRQTRSSCCRSTW